MPDREREEPAYMNAARLERIFAEIRGREDARHEEITTRLLGVEVSVREQSKDLVALGHKADTTNGRMHELEAAEQRRIGAEEERKRWEESRYRDIQIQIAAAALVVGAAGVLAGVLFGG